MVSGLSSCWYVNGVPHFPQKVRTTAGDERNAMGVPAENAKSVVRTTHQATDGAPLARRHELQ